MQGKWRTKWIVFGDIFHLLLVTIDDKLQQQLCLDEGLRDDRCTTKKAHCHLGNLTDEEDKLSERMSALEEKHALYSERSLRMDGHCFTLMEDVDRF
jgi:hypothetical protein